MEAFFWSPGRAFWCELRGSQAVIRRGECRVASANEETLRRRSVS